MNKKAIDNRTKPIEEEENIGNHIEPNEKEENNGVQNNENNGNDNDYGNDSVHEDDLDSEADVVESDLVVGSWTKGLYFVFRNRAPYKVWPHHKACGS